MQAFCPLFGANTRNFAHLSGGISGRLPHMKRSRPLKEKDRTGEAAMRAVGERRESALANPTLLALGELRATHEYRTARSLRLVCL
jgi:hypothetical protein